ncbi:MAG TPA: phosphoenolpyruvate--protein phosphotransferase [Pararobbsia sp.]|nr:phosphoenolpyruvate--protein phosphotransferase [Pararobbsia sp.]
MSFTLHGIPVSRGIAIGRAYLIAPAALDVDHYLVEPNQVEAEVRRFCTAQDVVQHELDTLRTDLPADAPSEMGAFLNVHLLILRDAMLAEATVDLIRTRRYNAEWALTEQLQLLGRVFDDVEDEYLRERKADIEQVVERVLKALAGAPGVSDGIEGNNEEMIVVAHDIAPADMLQFKTQTFRAFVTDLGGRTSHTAIVARSLGIPAAVGVQQASALIRQNDLIIVDGDHGIVIVDPAPIVLEEYSYRQSEKALEQRKLQRLKFAPAQTVDGTHIDLCANIELPEDAAAAVAAGAVGVGLFRTEFLFMNQGHHMPGEEEQFGAYRRAVEGMGGYPVTIRTIDVGADKPLDHRDEARDAYEVAPNPALGLRAIRYSLSEPQMFLTQLRAILRASALGPVKILIPMLAHAREIDQTLDLIAEAKRQCDAAGHAYDRNVKVGAMIEIPAAAIALPMFVNRLDFLSIGTNDLIQYTLAIDRADNAVAHLYDPLHPAVLHLISHTLREARRAGVPVSVCGEMAGDPELTRLLLGMGLTEFSMHPSQLLEVKQEVLRAHIPTVERHVQDVLAAFEPNEQLAALKRLERC